MIHFLLLIITVQAVVAGMIIFVLTRHLRELCRRNADLRHRNDYLRRYSEVLDEKLTQRCQEDEARPARRQRATFSEN